MSYNIVYENNKVSQENRQRQCVTPNRPNLEGLSNELSKQRPEGIYRVNIARDRERVLQGTGTLVRGIQSRSFPEMSKKEQIVCLEHTEEGRRWYEIKSE